MLGGLSASWSLGMDALAERVRAEFVGALWKFNGYRIDVYLDMDMDRKFDIHGEPAIVREGSGMDPCPAVCAGRGL